jgi:hypothetical protein
MTARDAQNCPVAEILLEAIVLTVPGEFRNVNLP